MNYYKLGETTGKAWRLGHMGATPEEQYLTLVEAIERLKMRGDSTLAIDFTQGFDAGCRAVDTEAARLRRD